MAGISISIKNVNRKFQDRPIETLSSRIVYATSKVLTSIGPMVTIMICIELLKFFVGFSDMDYIDRELVSSTFTYCFIISMILNTGFAYIIYKKSADYIFEKSYTKIWKLFHLTLLTMILVSIVIIGLIGCFMDLSISIKAGATSRGLFCFYSLLFAQYDMILLMAFRDYKRVAICFITGIFSGYISVLILREIIDSPVKVLILGMTFSFATTALLEYFVLWRYFIWGNKQPRKGDCLIMDVLKDMLKCWYGVFLNLVLAVGMYIHNFIFWGVSAKESVSGILVTAGAYDFACCIAVMMGMSEIIIHNALSENGFQKYYKDYMEAVIGGSLDTIEGSRKILFFAIINEIMKIMRIQLSVSIIAYIVIMYMSPMFSSNSKAMEMLPLLIVGMFIMFTMLIIGMFLDYFSDMFGKSLMVYAFVLGTFVFTLYSSTLKSSLYGLGLVLGSLLGFTVAYWRLSWVQNNLDYMIFCRGSIIGYSKVKAKNRLVYRKQD